MQIFTTVPAGHTGNAIYLLNFPAAHTSRRYVVTPISAQEMRGILEGADRPIVSALRHEGAAQAFAGLVGAEVPMSRLEVSFRPGDIALCCKLLRRPPEGAVLTREAMEEIGYQLIRVDVLLGDLETEIAERWVAVMRAMGADELRGEVVDGQHRGLSCPPGWSIDLVALGDGGPIGSIRVETEECPLETTRVSWVAVRNAWVAAGGRCVPAGTPRAGEWFRGLYDGEIVRGRVLTAKVAYGEVGKHVPEGEDPAALVALPLHAAKPVRLGMLRAMRPDGVIDPRDFTRRFQAGADLDALAAEHGLTRAQAEDVLRKHLPPCLYAEPAWPGRRRSR